MPLTPPSSPSPRVMGLVGWSGSGKTHLLTALVAHFVGQGLHLATLKHAHHGFDLDQPGKDSYAHRAAGAGQVLISSAKRVALMEELRGAPEPPLAELLTRLSPCDLVLVEGFKRENHPKLEVWRASVNKPLLAPELSNLRAVVSDDPVPDGMPRWPRADLETLARRILEEAEPWPS